MGVDGRKLWQEFLAYRAFAKSLPELSVAAAVQTIFDPGNTGADPGGGHGGSMPPLWD